MYYPLISISLAWTAQKGDWSGDNFENCEHWDANSQSGRCPGYFALLQKHQICYAAAPPPELQFQIMCTHGAYKKRLLAEELLNTLILLFGNSTPGLLDMVSKF